MRNKTIQVLCGFIVLFYSLLSGCATSTDQYQADSMEPKSAAIDVEMGNGDAMAAHRRAMLAEKGSKPGGMMNGGTGMAAGPCAMMTDGAGTAAGPCPILTNEDGTAGGMMVGGTGMAAGNCAMMPGENSMHPGMMQQHMAEMRDRMEAIKAATSDDERRKLTDELVQAMQMHMDMMSSM